MVLLISHGGRRSRRQHTAFRNGSAVDVPDQLCGASSGKRVAVLFYHAFLMKSARGPACNGENQGQSTAVISPGKKSIVDGCTITWSMSVSAWLDIGCRYVHLHIWGGHLVLR